MDKDLEKLAKQLDANKIKKQILKRFGVRSEEEFIRKALGTNDISQAKKILAQKLRTADRNNPLVKAAKSALDGKKNPQVSKRDLNRVLTPTQRSQLQKMLESKGKK